MKENGAPGTIRTSDPQIRSLMLYPAELRVHFFGAICLEENETSERFHGALNSDGSQF